MNEEKNHVLWMLLRQYRDLNPYPANVENRVSS